MMLLYRRSIIIVGLPLFNNDIANKSEKSTKSHSPYILSLISVGLQFQYFCCRCFFFRCCNQQARRMGQKLVEKTNVPLYQYAHENLLFENTPFSILYILIYYLPTNNYYQVKRPRCYLAANHSLWNGTGCSTIIVIIVIVTRIT